MSKSNRHGMFRNLLRVLKTAHQVDKKYAVVQLFLEFTNRVLPIVLTGFTALFINKITEGQVTSVTDPSLLWIIAGYIALPFIIDFIDIFRRKYEHSFMLRFQEWLDISFMDKKATVDIQVLEHPVFNDLVTKIKENSWRWYSFMSWSFDTFSFFAKLVIATVIIASYQWWIAVLLALALIPDLYAEGKYGKRVWSIWEAKASVKRSYFEAGSHYDNVPALIEMKVFATKNFFKHTVETLSGQFTKEVISNEAKRARIKNWTLVPISVVSAALILYLMDNVINGVLAIGTFTFILASMNSFRSGFSDFLMGISNMSIHNLFVSDIVRFIDTKSILKNGETKLGPETPDIEFKNVSFSYPENAAKVNVTNESETGPVKDRIITPTQSDTKPHTPKEVFTNFDFTIKAGEKIAIVGVNGAGKTTLTKLMLRFYDANKGEILVGGVNIKDLDLETYYKKIGYLSQEYDKFKLKVKDAIGIGNVDIHQDLDKVIEAAKRAGAHEFIKEWSEGYESYLGKEFEGGVEPSVGQWQKLALARLFYRNPQIWILDEPTASIDSIAEMEVFDELEALPDDKTVILISHRFNTVKNADKIMVIEEGEIKEFGNHAQLMQIENGVYKKLFTLQKESFDVIS